jgi:hypothetical protein
LKEAEQPNRGVIKNRKFYLKIMLIIKGNQDLLTANVKLKEEVNIKLFKLFT